MTNLVPPFDLPGLNEKLAGSAFAGNVHHVAVTSSTNTLAFEAAQAGVALGAWVADEQTAGRGRSGHRWHSTVGDGLYVSVLSRPRLQGAATLRLSLAAGLAARAAVLSATRVTAARIDLRWPNDLLLTGEDGVARKFGGILTETAMQGNEGRLAYAVIGIGLNLNHAALPEELKDVATSVRLLTGVATRREDVLTVLLPALAEQLAALEREGVDSLAARFEQASTWVRGAWVRVAEEGGYTGVTEGLDEHGLLRVRLEDGGLRTVRHGGVRRMT